VNYREQIMRLHQESIIKKLSYSELFEPSPPAGARTGAAENIPGNGGDQGTPERQRICGNESETRSQSAPAVGTVSSSSVQRQINNNNTHTRQFK
jgi:hypothetical protein